MASFTVGRDGIETDINDICFADGGTSEESAIEHAEFTWGDVAGSVMVRHNGRFYICDGVDPTTGLFFTDEIVNLLKELFGEEEVILVKKK